MKLALRSWRNAFLALFIVAALLWLAATLALRSQIPPAAAFTSPLPMGCVQQPAARLARMGCAAHVTSTIEGTLLVHVLPPPGQSPGLAAQTIWTAFDAVASLPADCPYRELMVIVTTEETRLQAHVSASDVRAWAEGLLPDTELVERVAYTEEPLDSVVP